MRTVIEAARPSVPRPSLRRPSSVRLAANAARQALEETGNPAQVDLLINVGVYRDGNICEPAMAPLIQRRIPSLAHRTDVFSLDLNNGACGLLNALQVVDAFVRAGSVRRALLVASDVDPDPRRSRGLAVRAAGVGIVATASEGDDGFLAFHSETFPEYAGLYEARLDWFGRQSLLGRAGHAVAVRTAPSYAERCAACAAASANHFLDAQGLGIDDVDLIVAPDAPAGFARALSTMLHVESERMSSDEVVSSGTHSAAPGLALAAAVASGRFGAAGRALLVAAGAGITVALALYGNEEHAGGA
jgi:3-oxoacyl-[acyl-carrier-protein] synthase-3